VLVALAEAAGAHLAPRFMREKEQQLQRHIRRVDPEMGDRAVEAAARRGFGSYARYWAESFRMPALSARTVDRGFSVIGYEHIEHSLDAGIGPILVLPHLGGWEWAAAWLNRVKGEHVAAVVERLEPADVFDWFVELRAAYGIEVIPVGSDAMSRLVRSVRAKRIVCLLSDRDLSGNGIEVDFFGERTTLPAGPALLAKRTGAPLLPTAVYFRGRGGHFARVEGPIRADPGLKLRDDLVRITQELAVALEDLISRAPDQWHLLGPNWPSDLEGV
jgi:KDO2-lipid IV(A) lauroyltransferase